MKKFIVLFFILFGLILSGQEKEVKKPEYVIIANHKIITKVELEDYGKQGLIKGMNKGVSQQVRDELAIKFGEKIGDREFVIIVDLFTETEKNKVKSKREKTKKRKVRKAQLKLNINDVANEFTVEMIDGEKITLSDLKGKVVLVNYWATWCAPCLMEFSEIPEKILEPFKGKDFVFIPISIGESKKKVQKKISKMEKYGVNFNVGIDPKKEIWNEYATGSIPKNFIIDKNGIIKYTSIGNYEGNVDKLAAEIKKLLSE